MEHATDIELLQNYVENNSESAFAALVQRHVNLVYSAALRQVRDADGAQEVAQVTFIILARKAHKLNQRTILSAWLYRTARFAAADFLKRRNRRLKYEQEAARMESATSDATWEQIEPLLDEAVNRLGEADRAVLVLRFFENKSLREIGDALGLSDDTAQKRLSRALERLRKTFASNGVTLSLAALTSAISARAVESAPSALAHSIAQTSTSTASVSATTTALVKGTLQMIARSQWKLGLGVAALVLLTAGTATVVAQKKLSAERTNTVAEAEDRSTPIGALRFFARALENFDATNVAASLYAQNPSQERFLNAMVSVIRSEGTMRKALEEKFGTNYTPALPKRAIFAMSFGQEQLDLAEAEISGTNAVIRVPGRNDRSDEMRMIRIGGVWKLSGDKGDSPQAAKGVESMERVSAAVESFTAAITNGEFSTAAAAVSAMRGRIGQAMRTRTQDGVNR